MQRIVIELDAKGAATIVAPMPVKPPIPEMVSIDDEFEIGKYPVTNREWAAFVAATNRKPPSHWVDGKIPDGLDLHPVVNVSWHDSVAYCEWLSEVTGDSYQLPTEKQWQRAAQGNDERIYPWGDEWDATKCNSWEGNVQGTTPVGKYSPEGDSPYGCADMAGNVWEWTASKWKDDDDEEDNT